MNNILLGSLIGTAIGFVVSFVLFPAFFNLMVWVDRKYFGRTW